MRCLKLSLCYRGHYRSERPLRFRSSSNMRCVAVAVCVSWSGNDINESLILGTPKSVDKSPPSDSVLGQIAAHDLFKYFTRFSFKGLVFGVSSRDSSSKQVIEELDCPFIKVGIKFF
jgi:hypothetical protein